MLVSRSIFQLKAKRLLHWFEKKNYLISKSFVPSHILHTDRLSPILLLLIRSYIFVLGTPKFQVLEWDGGVGEGEGGVKISREHLG